MFDEGGKRRCCSTKVILRRMVPSAKCSYCSLGSRRVTVPAQTNYSRLRRIYRNELVDSTLGFATESRLVLQSVNFRRYSSTTCRTLEGTIHVRRVLPTHLLAEGALVLSTASSKGHLEGTVQTRTARTNSELQSAQVRAITYVTGHPRANVSPSALWSLESVILPSCIIARYDP